MNNIEVADREMGSRDNASRGHHNCISFVGARNNICNTSLVLVVFNMAGKRGLSDPQVALIEQNRLKALDRKRRRIEQEERSSMRDAR